MTSIAKLRADTIRRQQESLARTAKDRMNKQLRDALNLIGDHVAKNLPSGYSIAIALSSDECDLTLYDPDGNDIELPTLEPNDSAIDQACREATEDLDANGKVDF
jgi:hypothetical protein